MTNLDYMGNDLKVGDEVLFIIPTNWRINYYTGVIHKINKQLCIKGPYDRKYYCYADNCVKVENLNKLKHYIWSE